MARCSMYPTAWKQVVVGWFLARRQWWSLPIAGGFPCFGVIATCPLFAHPSVDPDPFPASLSLGVDHELPPPTVQTCHRGFTHRTRFHLTPGTSALSLPHTKPPDSVEVSFLSLCSSSDRSHRRLCLCGVCSFMYSRSQLCERPGTEARSWSSW